MKLTDEQIENLLPLIDFHAGVTSGQLEDLITSHGLDYDNEDIEDLMTVYNDLLSADVMANADAKQHVADNPVTSETVIDKDDDGDADVTITKQDDGDDDGDEDELLDGDDKPHDQGLAGDTTLEEELMLKPDMSPTEFSKKAAEKRGAKPGEPAPDFNNFTNAIARNLASRRW